MTLVWLAGASVLSWLAVGALGGNRVNPEAFYGMAGPLVAVCLSWLAVRRAHRRGPERVMAVMMAGFALKLVFFGAYIAVMIKAVGLRPLPFVTAFVSYFIALYAMQAFLLWRLLGSRHVATRS